MAVPSFVAHGTNASGGSPVAPAITGLAADDIMVLMCASAHYVATAPAGWNVLPNFPVVGPTNGGGAPWLDPGGDHAIRIDGWWKRSVGGEGGTTVTVTNGHVVQFAIRGCVASGNPFESVVKDESGVWTPATYNIPAGSTATPDCLVVEWTSASQTGSTISSYTNADLAALTERLDADAGGGGLYFATGTKAAAGAFGATAAVVSGGGSGTWIGASLVMASQAAASLARSIGLVI